MMNRSTFLIALAFLTITAADVSAQTANGMRESEAYRPRFHFSPAFGWMSDPNGLVWFDGEYHLFYQHMPQERKDGAMHWGHAVSGDLLRWEQLPPALYPDSLGYIFSGCCVADLRNTSRLGTAENPPLLAIFTYYDPQAARQSIPETQSQGLAYSTDKGRTWTKYDRNPILLPPAGLGDFRDPKVIWHEQSAQWIMVLTGGQSIKFYGSPNCIDWHQLSDFSDGYSPGIGPWECPDFFPLKAGAETKWVLIASLVDFTDNPDRLNTKTQYIIGDFDGKKFTSGQKETLWMDYGKDCYAGITFDNEPHDRRLCLAWMHSHQYAWGAWDAITHTWSGAGSFPRELGMVKDNIGYRLVMAPADEIEALYADKVKIAGTKFAGVKAIAEDLPFAKAPVEVRLTFSAKDLPSVYGFKISNGKGEYVSMSYDSTKKQFSVDRTNATGVVFSEPFASVQKAPLLEGASKTMDWRILIDVASVELFVDGGRVVFSDVFYSTEPFDTFEVFSEGGTATLKSGTITEIRSVL